MFNYEPCCANCKYANWYPIPYMFPWCSPKCSKHKKDIQPQDVCDNFKLIGRLSR